MKQIFASALALVLGAALLAGCTASAAGETSLTPMATVTPMATPAATATATPAPPSSSSASSSEDLDHVEQALSVLMEGQYPALTMTAAMAGEGVTPGNAATVEITLLNEGDETLVYSQGSYAMENPSALLMKVEGLQPVLSQDQLETVTDASTRYDGEVVLEPGAEKVFEMQVMAIEPNADFEERTYSVFATDEEYIADLQWEELIELYPDLEKAAPGTYTGHAYFTYYVLKDGEMVDGTQTPTGYQLADFDIIVAE